MGTNPLMKNLMRRHDNKLFSGWNQERFEHSSVGRYALFPFLLKQTPHSSFVVLPLASVNSKFGWYLQKTLRRSSENSIFNTRCY